MKVELKSGNVAALTLSDSFSRDISMPPGATLEQANDFISRVESILQTPMNAVKTIYEDVFTETLEIDETPNESEATV